MNEKKEVALCQRNRCHLVVGCEGQEGLCPKFILHKHEAHIRTIIVPYIRWFHIPYLIRSWPDPCACGIVTVTLFCWWGNWRWGIVHYLSKTIRPVNSRTRTNLYLWVTKLSVSALIGYIPLHCTRRSTLGSLTVQIHLGRRKPFHSQDSALVSS